MSFATDKWFKHIRQEMLTEGLNDIGLPQELVDIIRSNMPSASEKGRVWIGNAFKGAKPVYLLSFVLFVPSFYDDIQEYQDRFGSYYQNQSFNILEELFDSMVREKYSSILKKRKSFIKSSKKLGIDQKIANSILHFVDDHMATSLTSFLSMIENTVLTLSQDPNNYKVANLFDKIVYIPYIDPDTGEKKTKKKYLYDSISDFPPSEWELVEEKASIYQGSLDKEDQIIQTFDDGSYWYDLESNYCEIESERMGHCGNDDDGTLYSLRKKDKESGAVSKSFVTIAYSENENTIFQIKGRFNTCPPESLWNHIADFIRNMGAKFLRESGQHSEEQEKFEEFGEWLAGETGIIFEGSLEKRIQNMTDECEGYEQSFRETHGEHTSFNSVLISSDDDWGGAETTVRWSQEDIDFIVVQMPFELEGKYLHLLEEDLGVDYAGDLLDIIESNDGTNITGYYGTRPEFSFIKANSLGGATGKWLTYGGRGDTGEIIAAGSSTFLVLSDITTAISEGVSDDLDTADASNYNDFLRTIETFINDVEGSGDEIKSFLIENEVIPKPSIISYREKVEENFNNFVISTLKKQSQYQYIIGSSAILFYTTQEEMQTIRRINVFSRNNGFYKNAGGYYYSEEFKTKILKELAKKEGEAIEFAKRQMKLNFGEKYEQKIDSLWEKFSLSGGYIGSQASSLKNNMFAGISAYSGDADERKQKLKQDYFTYTMKFDVNESTFPFYGPLIEYYDNNFDLIVGAFNKVVKEYIREAAIKHREETQQSDALPMQEARANPLDVRLYEIDFVMSYPLQQGFEITDIHNIVRAIPDVTTVRTIGAKKRSQGNRSLSLQRLKFALQGQKSRKEWVKQVLVPQIRKISSTIRLHRVEPADLVSSSKQRLEELYYNSSMRQSSARTTPVPAIQSLVDDWVEGGVMYDQPTNINLTRYSVMMSVEDLKPYLSREARKHGHHFDAGYQNFIEIGPRDPIYLAIGKNGRAKITGNEDDLRYAIKAGVEEVPVFISYQRQV